MLYEQAIEKRYGKQSTKVEIFYALGTGTINRYAAVSTKVEIFYALGTMTKERL